MKITEYMKRHSFAAFPLLLMTALGLAVWLWPPNTWPSDGVASSVRPPVAGPGAAVPETILSVVQGQAVGAEAYFHGFRLNSGWYLSEKEGNKYDLVADVTNIDDTPDTARVLVSVRVGDREAELMWCNASIPGGETKRLECVDSGRSQYTSRWSRITISAV